MSPTVLRHWFAGMDAVRGYAAPPQQPGSEMEKRVLENPAGTLQSELDAIEKRLSEIETGNTGQ